MNDTILGVIVGGVIAILGSLIGFIVQYKLELAKGRREQRKQAYVYAIKWISRLGTSDMEFLNDTYAVYEEARIGIYLYGSKTTRTLFDIANKNDATPQDRERFKQQVYREIGY